MIKLIIFILVSYGITNILIYGSIFEKWRDFIGASREEPKNLGKLFSCFMCLSFWVGVLVSLIMFSPTLTYGMFDKVNFLNIFFDACLASGGVWLVHTLQEHLEQ